MKSTLLLLCFISSFHSIHAQPFTLNLGYVSDIHAGNNWYNERGGRIGFGVDGIRSSDDSFLDLSVRNSVFFTGAKNNVRLDAVEFENPNSSQNDLGFARAEFRKFGFSMDFDFGYSVTEYDVFVPYITFGPRVENYGTKVHYELYEDDTCYCNTTTDLPLTNTLSFGFNTGLGFKLRFGEGFAVDFRANYYGGWSTLRKENVMIPMAETFEINPYGSPVFEHSTKRYNDGFLFSVNLIIPFPTGGGMSSGGYYSSSDDDYFDSDDDDTGGSSSTKECETRELTPAGRGGG